MPTSSRSIIVNHTESTEILAFCIGTFEKLKWEVKSSAGNTIVANYWDKEVIAVLDGQQLTVSIDSNDLVNENEELVSDFIAEFNNIKSNHTEEELGSWVERLSSVEANESSSTPSEPATKSFADGLSFKAMPITLSLMGINILIFVLTVISGVDIMQPVAGDLLPWGANYSPLTMSGEWWRLFTSTFLHFGVIHLALNMYALFFIGSNLEPILGKTRFLSAYIFAGILASVASLLWHKEGSVVSAGASGAVFGMYGVFLALLTTNLIPKHERNKLLQSIVIFVAYNIFYGLKSNTGIDNAAHIGGLISGMAIGYAYYASLRSETTTWKTQTVTGILAVATAAIVFFSVNKKQSDDILFAKAQEEFMTAETKALKPFENAEPTVEDIDNIMMPQWLKAKQMLDKTADYKLNERNKFLRDHLSQYIDLRIELTELARKALSENSTEYDDRANEIAQQINDVIDDLKNAPLEGK